MAKLKSGTRIYGTATIDTSVVVGSAVTASSSGIQVAGVTTTATLNVGTGGTIITTTGIGSVGIGTTNPTSKLHVQGDVRITGFLYDTTNSPGSRGQVLGSGSGGPTGATWTTVPVGVSLQKGGVSLTGGNAIILNFVGPNVALTSVSAISGIGTITIADYVSNSGYSTNAGISTHLKGGLVGNIPYQSAANTTTFLENGTSNYVLQSNGIGNAPSWVAAAPSGAVTGLVIRDSNNTIVGTSGSVSQLTLGSGLSVTGTTGAAGIATITLSSNIVGTALSISGISTLGVTSATNLTAQQLNVSGVSTFAGITTHTASLFGTQASFTGIVTGSQLVSNIATGTAPLTVTSTTVVSNLNSQYLNGQLGSYYTTAGNLSGTIPSAVLGNSTVYVGTTAIALNRTSANQSLTGILSVAMPGSTSGTITVQPTAVAGTNTITLPASTGTVALTSDLGNGTLNLAVSGTGLSGSASFTANQTGNTTFTVTSNATNANTVSTIVARDASGNFSAGTITASLTGAASLNVLKAGDTMTGQLISTLANNTATGGGQIYLNGATGNRIDFNGNGVAAPAFATRSVGTKIVLYSGLGASAADYGFGIESSTLWSSVPTSSDQFKWYGGTTNIATLSGTGNLSITGIATATQLDLTANATANDSVLYLSGAPTGSSGTNGLFGIGALNFSDTDIIANFTHNVNSYAQLVVQNKNSGSTSSADIIVNNDRSAGTTYYGDFGINGTTFSGGGVFGDVDGTYLYSAGGTLSLGSLNSYDVKIATNNTERVRVSAGGSVGIGTTNPLQKLHVLGNLLVSAGSSTGQHITQKAYELNSGTLSWEGSAGQLFSITNNLTSGSIFSINDVSGIPSIDVNDDGTVLVAPYGGNLGVGTISPTSKLHVNGQITSTQANSTTTGGGQIYLNGATGNRIDFNANGVAAPTFTTRSVGTKIVLYPSVSGSAVDYGFGIEGSTLWSSVGTTSEQFKWYAGTTNIATLSGAGALSVTGTVSGTNITTGGNVTGSSASVANAATFNSGGAGAASGTTFNGSAAQTISYNTLGASPLAGSSSLVTTGTVTSGTWSGSFGAVSGANLTSLNATNLGSGTVPVLRLGDSGTRDATTYLRGDNTWQTVSGGATLNNSPSGTLYPTMSSATSGTYSTAYVSSTALTFTTSTGTLSATVFTSLSDVNKKKNIRPIENAIGITKKLEGVRFDWKDTDAPSIGVIAQEVEKVLPELVVESDGVKSVSYGNIVGVLIEAIKEQQVRIEELERKLNA